MRTSFLLILILFSCSKKETIHYSGQTMGTTFNISFFSDDKIDTELLYEQINKKLHFIDKEEMSTWTQSSTLAKFNASHNIDKTYTVSDELMNVIEESIIISDLTAGAFDVTVMPLVNAWGFGWKGRPKLMISESTLDSIRPFIGYKKILIEDGKIKKSHPNLEIDLSAIAKGYAVDLITEIVEDFGIQRYLVEIGGEVRSKGLNGMNIPWRIGIDKPSLDLNMSKSFEEIVAISGWSVATSGDYRNYYIKDGKKLSHTIDPMTMKPVEHELGSVTVIAKTCMRADALATSCMVLGVEKGLKLIESLEDVEAMFIERVGEEKYKTTATSGFQTFVYKTK